jgi:hypothetical protein
LRFDSALATLDVNKDGKIALAEAKDNLLKAAFEAFDLNRDGLLDASEWEVYRAMMAAENGLLAIKLGGKGDMTASSIKWRYQKPVPQVPSTLSTRAFFTW